MSQGTFPLAATQSGTQYTEDLNALLSGINSNNASNDAPESGLEEGVLWLDTSQTPPILRIYDASIPGFVPLGVNGDAFRTVVIYKNSLVTPTPVPSSTNTVLNVTLDGFTTNTQSWSLTQTTPGTGADTYTAIGTFEQANSIGDYTTVGDWSTPAQLSGNDGSTGARSPIIGFYVPMVTRNTTPDPDTFTSPLANFNPDGLLGTNTDNQAYLDASFSQFFFGNLTSDAVEGDYGVFYNNSVETENLVASYDAASGNWITGTKKISGNLFVDGSIEGDALDVNALTSKIVKSGKNSFTDTQSGFFLSGDGNFVVGGDANNQLKWDGSNLTIPALAIGNGITSTQIADGAITTNKIEAGAITAVEIKADSISADKLTSLELSVAKKLSVGNIRVGAEDELAEATEATDTSITVLDTTAFPETGSVLIGGTETFVYTSKTDDTETPPNALISTTDTIEAEFDAGTVVIQIIAGYPITFGTGVVLDGSGKFAVGSVEESLVFDGTNLVLSGVPINANDLVEIASLDGKISSSLQTYADLKAYAEGDVVIDTNKKIFRVKTGQSVADTNTTAPVEGTIWEEISGAAAGVTVDNAISENGTNPVQGGAIFTALAGKQAVDATLTAIAGLTAADGGFIVGTGTAEGNWTVESGSDARTSLGLGTVATLDTGTGSGNIPILNSSGKISSAVLDIVNLSDVENFTTIALRNASVATIWHKGDIAIITTGTDLGTYLYTGTDQTTAAATLSSAWTVLQLPTGVVTSVAGGDGVTASASTGTVTLSADIKANSGIVLTGTTPNKKLDLNLGASGITGTLAVQDGGTGASSLTDGGILLGSGTGAITTTGVLTNGQMLVGDGTTDPVLESGATLRTSIGVGTGDSPLLTGVSVGNADTTITRNSAGNVNVEGKLLYRADGTDVPVKDGGTGTSSLTDGGILLGSGTNAITATAVLTNGQMIVGDGTGDPVLESGATLRTSIGVGTGDSPQFTAVNVGSTDTTISRNSAGNINVEGKLVYRADGTDVPVKDGGTGASTFTDGGILLGSGTDAITATAVLTNGQMIVGDGTGDPVLESGATLRTSIGVGTGDSPQFTAVNVGSTDTTITRESAGDIDIEGNIVYRAGGTDVPVADGGTGLSTVAIGDILYASAANTLSALTKGDDGKVLKLASGIPSWADDNDTTLTVKNGDAVLATAATTLDFGQGITASGNAAEKEIVIATGGVRGATTNSGSQREINQGTIGTLELRNASVNNAKLGVGAISLDKMVISEFPTVVWKTAYTLRDGTPTNNGSWQAYTNTDLTTVAGDNATWDTIRGIKLRTTDAGGLDITNLINALETGSYIRIRQTDTTFAVYRVGTTHTVSSNVGSISFQNDFQLEGLYGNKDTDIADIEFQVKTDAIIDGNLIVTGTINASSVNADSGIFGTIAAETATIGSLDVNFIDATSILTETLVSNRIQAGAINADRIVSNSIDTLQLKAGSVTADEIAAGAITADKITVDGNIEIEPPTGNDDHSIQGWADSTVRDWDQDSTVPVANALDDILGLTASGTLNSAGNAVTGANEGSSGFFLGQTEEGPRFFIGNADGAESQFMKWNGSQLIVAGDSLVQLNASKAYYYNFNPNAGSSGGENGYNLAGSWCIKSNADTDTDAKRIRSGIDFQQRFVAGTQQLIFKRDDMNATDVGTSIYDNIGVGSTCRVTRVLNRTAEVVDFRVLAKTTVSSQGLDSGTGLFFEWFQIEVTVVSGTPADFLGNYSNGANDDHDIVEFAWRYYDEDNQGIELGSILGSNSYGTHIVLGENAVADDRGSIVAIGRNSEGLGEDSIAIGDNASAGFQTVGSSSLDADTGDQAIAIGSGAFAKGDDSIYIGNAFASDNAGLGSISIGKASSATAVDGIAIGNGADANENDSIAIGADSDASAEEAIAIGQDADATGDRAIAIGSESDAIGANSIAIGSNGGTGGEQPVATGTSSIAIGVEAQADAENSIAIGTDSSCNQTNAIAIGNESVTNSASSIAIGRSAKSSGLLGVVIGDGILSNGDNNTIIGSGTSDAVGSNMTSIGHSTNVGAGVSSTNCTAIGFGAVATEDDLLVLGNSSATSRLGKQTGSNVLDIATKKYVDDNGGDAYFVSNSTGTAVPTAGGADAIAVGLGASAANINSVAIGKDSSVSKDGGTALGLTAIVTGTAGTAIGQLATAGPNSSSTALGLQATAFGQSSIAIGFGSNAAATDSIAIGEGALASFNDSIAIGDLAKSSGTQAIAIGNAADAREVLAVSIGSNSDASTNAIAIGNNSNAFGTSSIAIGDNSNVNTAGTNSVALGNDTDANGIAAVAIGDGAQATGSTTVALGDNARATATSATALGEGTLCSGGSGISIGRDAVNSGGFGSIALGYATSTGTFANSIAFGRQTTISAADTIRFGNSSVDVIGGQVDFTITSDRRDKTNISDLDSSYGLDLVNSVDPKTYNPDPRARYAERLDSDGEPSPITPDGTLADTTLSVGFLAQDLEAAMTDSYQVVHNTDSENLTMRYGALTPILWKAVQQLSTENDALKARLDALENP